jgi:hypothetical protein
MRRHAAASASEIKRTEVLFAPDSRRLGLQLCRLALIDAFCFPAAKNKGRNAPLILITKQ